MPDLLRDHQRQCELERENSDLRTLLAFCEGVLSIVESKSFNVEGVKEARRRIKAAGI